MINCEEGEAQPSRSGTRCLAGARKSGSEGDWASRAAEKERRDLARAVRFWKDGKR